MNIQLLSDAMLLVATCSVMMASIVLSILTRTVLRDSRTSFYAEEALMTFLRNLAERNSQAAVEKDHEHYARS